MHPDKKKEEKDISRRRFLISVGAGGSGLALSGLFAAMFRSVLPNVLYEPSARFKVGRPEHYLPGSTTYLPERKIFIFHDLKGLYAVSSICTHLGCNVRLNPEQDEFICPCHGSKFTREGNVLKGPAQNPLVRYTLLLSRKGELIADQNVLVDQNFRLIL